MSAIDESGLTGYGPTPPGKGSEIKERVKEYIDVFRTGKAVKIITDLLAELERVETENRIRGEMYADLQHRTGACEHVRLKQCIGELEDTVKAHECCAKITKQRIAELETENDRMKADLSGSFFVEQIRQKAAMECVDEMEDYPTSVSVHVTAHDAKIASATKRELIAAVKAKFGLEKK